MDSRERVAIALSHEEPDRIPIDFWASTGLIRHIQKALGVTYEAFLDKWDVDFRYIDGPRYIGPPLAAASGRDIDIWGVERRIVEVPGKSGVETYSEVAVSPLAFAQTPDDVENYPGWPSPDWFDYFVVRAQCEAVRRKGRVAVFMGDRLNRVAQLKPAMYIRGVEQILVDVAINPEIARALFGRVRSFYAEYLGRILDAAGGGIDIVLTGDDFGGQNGPLVSPSAWDEFLRGGFAEYMGITKSHGVRTMHHTCGSVVPIIGRMVDCGLEILQSLQPEADGMDPAALKRDFGARLSFQGGISIQRTMPFGTPTDVRKEVERLASAFGPGGGYIFCTSHNIQTDTAVENVLALLEAYHEFGRY